MANKKPLRERTPKDFSVDELVKLRTQLERRRPHVGRKVKKQTDILLLMIKEELDARGFGKEAELKQSINNKKQSDEGND